MQEQDVRTKLPVKVQKMFEMVALQAEELKELYDDYFAFKERALAIIGEILVFAMTENTLVRMSSIVLATTDHELYGSGPLIVSLEDLSDERKIGNAIIKDLVAKMLKDTFFKHLYQYPDKLLGTTGIPFSAIGGVNVSMDFARPIHIIFDSGVANAFFDQLQPMHIITPAEMKAHVEMRLREIDALVPDFTEAAQRFKSVDDLTRQKLITELESDLVSLRTEFFQIVKKLDDQLCRILSSSGEGNN